MEFTTLKKHRLNLSGFDNADLSADPAQVQNTVSNHTGGDAQVRVYTPESLNDLKEHMVAISELKNPTETETASLEAAYKEVTSLKKDAREVDGIEYPVYVITTTNEDYCKYH